MLPTGGVGFFVPNLFDLDLESEVRIDRGLGQKRL